MAVDSASKQEEAAALAGTWDGDKRVISKYAHLVLTLKVSILRQLIYASSYFFTIRTFSGILLEYYISYS